MRQLGIFRLIAIALGVVAAVNLARGGFAFFLSDLLTELFKAADYWLSSLLRPLDPLVAALFALLKELGLIHIPKPRDHWRHVLVLMSLLFTNYVRATAAASHTGRVVFLASWGALCALLSSALSGMVQFADERILYFPAAGICLFFAGARVWSSDTKSPMSGTLVDGFGASGLLFLLGAILFTSLALVASQSGTIVGLSDLNELVRRLSAATSDQLPSPGLALLTVVVAGVGGMLAAFGFFQRGLRVAPILIAPDPGRSMGRNILIVVGAAVIVVTMGRLQTYLEPADPKWELSLSRVSGGPIRIPIGHDALDKNGPLVSVRPFAMSVSEVTQAQFARFVDEAGYVVDGYCQEFMGTQGAYSPATSGAPTWRNPVMPGYGPTHPVVCVSLHDARAYARWLSDKTKRHYRLPTEAEWEFALRGDRTVAFDLSMLNTNKCRTFGNTLCMDTPTYTMPAGSQEFRSTGFQLRDMIGNVAEWTEGCWDAACSRRVVRGGSWKDDDLEWRDWFAVSTRTKALGFRLAREE